MTARTAAGRPALEGGSVHAATRHDTVPPLRGDVGTTTPSSDTTAGTPPSAGFGSTDTSSGSDSASRTSKNSGEPSSGSTRRWRQPRNVREFAAQANAVATMVLNGTMNLDSARTYSSVARTVAQAMSTEVSRARFVATEPSLELADDVFEDET